MAEENEQNSAEGQDNEAEGEAGGGKKSKKKLIIIILAIVILGAVAFFMLGGKKGGDAKEPNQEEIDLAKEEEEEEEEKTYYYKMDEFLVNLNSPGNSTKFVRTTISIVLDSKDAKDALEKQMPVVRDSFLVYLKELRPSDLKGSSGIYNLKDELLLRVNKLIEPDEATDILFEEIVVQGQ